MWGPAGLADTLVELGILTPELAPRMAKGGTTHPIGLDIATTQVHAEHSSEFVYVNPDTKKREVHVGGEPVGFIIKLENGFTIYHMGDTGLFGYLTLIGQRYRPDLLLIPIGGNFVMDPSDAAEATRIIRPHFAIPMHYGTTPQLARHTRAIPRGVGQDRDRGQSHATRRDRDLRPALASARRR